MISLRVGRMLSVQNKTLPWGEATRPALKTAVNIGDEGEDEEEEDGENDE